MERAKHLLDSGALTPEEFEAEKARLLGNNMIVDADSHEPEKFGISRRTRAFIATCVAAGLIGLVMLWSKSGSAPSTSSSDLSVQRDSMLASPTEEPSSTPSAAATVDLSNTLQFSTPSQCTAAGTLEKVFAKLDTARDAQSTSATVKLDEFADGLPVRVEQATDRDGVVEQSSEIGFTREVDWNGLRLSRIRTNLVAPPETDSSYSRILTFRDEPETVRLNLARLGFAAPLAPSYAELRDDACGGTMYVGAVSGGAALYCGWGC
ncbi:MAG: SHOCT domain-containing protein [Candidatus Binataceae bacterium]